MQRVILVVSPDPDFLQQIRSHLEEGGRYQVAVAGSAQDALTMANNDFFEVAILDSELDDIPMVAFSRDLAALQTELKILVYPPDNNPQHPLLDGLAANGFLSKPFSGPEIGTALTNLFSDQSTGPDLRVKQIDDLMKQWLQNPETGGEKAEHILKSTTAQSVLIIIKGQTTASAGSTSDNLETNVIGFLSRYWKDDEDIELARFLRMDGDAGERFLYATKLVSNVVLALIYPHTTTIQQVRRELSQVKDDFQRNYPTTAELRQDIAKQALAEINERNKKLESMQTFSATISQSELDELKILQEQQKSAPTPAAISEEELANLNKLIEELPSPDPEPKQEIEPQPTAVAADIPDWLHELDQLAVKSLPSAEPEKATADQTEKPLFEEQPEAGIQSTTPINDQLTESPEADLTKSPAVDEPLPVNNAQVAAPIAVLATDSSESPEVDLTKPSTVVEPLPANNIQDAAPIAGLAAESIDAPLTEPTPVVEDLPEIDFKLPWETEETENVEPAINVGTVTDENLPAEITQDEVSPAALSVEDTASAIAEETTVEKDFAQVLEEVQVDTAAVSPDETTDSVPEESAGVPPLETIASVTATAEPDIIPPLGKEDGQPIIEETIVEEPVIEEPVIEEPVSNLPPELKDFRFVYTCILIPESRDQFLARDLSEKLGVVMPQFHLAQGWHLTSITIRPQYLLWTLTAPFTTCPQQIIHDIRALTSAHIFANFPDIAKNKTTDDFWSSNYLVVSGSEPPPVNLIYDFVTQAWKKKETSPR